MDDDRVERRAVLGVGAAVLASLSGCARLFIEPESTPTPDGETPEPTPTATPTGTPTATPTRTAEPTPTADRLPSDSLEIRNRNLSIRLSRTEAHAFVRCRFDVENTGRRPISDVEFRADVRYVDGELSRIVATGYPRFWFVPFDDDEDDDGLGTDETERVRDELRFERDGRAEGSTAVDRFELELSIRRIRHV